MMRRTVGWMVLCCAGLLQAVAQAPIDDTPEPRFSADQAQPAADGIAVTTAEISPTAATAQDPRYWRVRLQLLIGAADRPKQARVYLPTSSARQTIFERTLWGEPLRYRETASGDNLLGQWYTDEPIAGAQTVTADVTVRIDGAGRALPLTSTERANREHYLSATDSIPVRDAAVLAQAAALARQSSDPAARAIASAQFVSNGLAQSSDDTMSDVATVLRTRQATPLGKARTLAALLRAGQIPARVVGGLVLDAVQEPARYTYWVEAAIEQRDADGETELHWMEFDPWRGYHDGHVPNTHLVLFHGDQAWIRHSANLDFSYTFKVQQLAPDDALAELAPGDSLVPGRANRALTGTNAASVTNPVATILWVTDRTMPATLTDKFVAAASAQRVKVVFLTAPYGSRLFRAEHMTELMQRYDRVLRQADAIVLHTADDAGFYALLAQGARSALLKNKVVYVAGAMWPSVGEFLGRTVMGLFRPRALYVLPQSLDSNAMWDLSTANFLDGTPMNDLAAAWHLPVLHFPELAQTPLSRWRQFLLDTWTVAAREGVSPQSLLLVLVIPLIALLVVIYRGILGFQSFGTFAPVILCVAFLRTGALWGIVMFAVILGVGALLRGLVTRWRLFMAARMALLLGVIGLLMLAVGVVGIWWGVGPLVNISVLPMVIMAGVIENFTRTQMESGWVVATRLAIATLGLCVGCYLVLDWLSLQSLVLVYPEIVLAGIACTVLLGRWRGLRVVEMIRFYRLGRRND